MVVGGGGCSGILDVVVPAVALVLENVFVVLWWWD